MGSTQADLSFLMTMLMVFRKSPQDGFSTSRMVSLVMGDILEGNIPGCQNMTSKLFLNFF